MAKVQGVKEKAPFASLRCFLRARRGDNNRRKFSELMTDPRMIRFFVDVQNKTKLETNLQASGVLPSLNDFEATGDARGGFQSAAVCPNDSPKALEGD